MSSVAVGRTGLAGVVQMRQAPIFAGSTRGPSEEDGRERPGRSDVGGVCRWHCGKPQRILLGMAQKARILIQTVHDVTVATIEDSSIIDPQHIEEMRRTLFELIEKQDRRRLILDITKVRHLSSAALGVLIPLQEAYRKAKGTMVLVGVSDGIMKLFKLTKLDKLLEFAATEKEALRSFGLTADQ